MGAGKMLHRIDSRLLSYGLALAISMLGVVRTGFARPDNAFDLTGPKIEINVTRAGKTLGIADVPNLLPGDRLWIHVDLPDDQSVHYLLVVAFLRGTTNPAARRLVHESGDMEQASDSGRRSSLPFPRTPSRPCCF